MSEWWQQPAGDRGRDMLWPVPVAEPPPPPSPPSPPRRRGPGWGALVVVALVSSLVGGALGARLGAAAVLREATEEGLLVQARGRAQQPAAAPLAPESQPGVAGGGSGAAAPGLPPAQMTIEFSSAVSEAARQVGPAVVGIVNQVEQRRGYAEVGTGSGVIFDREQGVIVTNAHVVAIDDYLREYQRLVVKTSDEQTLEAELVGADELTDLAVLRVEAGTLPAEAAFGDSDAVQVGDLVVAIGNPLGLDFARSVTAGIISGLNRDLPIQTEDGIESTLQVIQTDAAINPGNSGGALVNAAGQVIGINSAKIAREDVEGLNFAIPVNFARPIITELLQHGRVVRPLLGVRGYATRAEQQWNTGYTGEGLVVMVIPGGPAAQAGLEDYDIILSMDGRPVNRLGELVVILGNYDPGETVQVRVRRIEWGGQVREFTVPVTLAQGEG